MIFIYESIIMDTKDNVELINITKNLNQIIRENKIEYGLINISTKHTTSGIIINEDESGLKMDIVNFFEKNVPHGDYYHDRIDNNARSHLKSLLSSPSQTLPIIDSEVSLGTWQSIFFIELDGPRRNRRVDVMIIKE